MKAFLFGIFLAISLTLAVDAQTAQKQHHHKKDGSTNSPANAEAPDTAAADAAADQAKQIADYQKAFVPADPWRILNEKTNYAKGADWVQFEGHVIRSSAEGLILQGWFGEPLAYMMPGGKGMTSGTFLLSNFPRHVQVGTLLSRNDHWVALKAGDKNGMPSLDYGNVWVPELTEEQKAAASSAKSKADAKVLAWHQELADKGDAYGEYKMGMRYLNGDGVTKDLDKARDLFNKSSAQGNKDATDALAKLAPN